MIAASSTSGLAPTRRRRPRRLSILTSCDSAMATRVQHRDRLRNGQKRSENENFIILARLGPPPRPRPLAREGPEHGRWRGGLSLWRARSRGARRGLGGWARSGG